MAKLQKSSIHVNGLAVYLIYQKFKKPDSTLKFQNSLHLISSESAAIIQRQVSLQ